MKEVLLVWASKLYCSLEPHFISKYL